MKNILFCILVTSILYCCKKIPVEKGFLSNEISLKGADTIDVPMGIRTNTDVAWLDGSSEPVEFYIEDVRDASGNHSEQFFKPLSYRSWLKPYNDKTDTTLALVMEKISEQQSPPVLINKTNGALYFLETTNALTKPGDIFHVDVRVKNSKGDLVIKDYAILRLSKSGQDFTVNMVTTALLLVNAGGATSFTLYDNVQADPIRIQNIYDRNGKELADIYKMADTPSVGVRLLVQFKDAEGKIYPSQDYKFYDAGLDSYFKLGLNRKNTTEGAWVEFPMTPWPVNSGYLTTFEKSGTYDFTVLDTTSLKNDLYVTKKYAYNAVWPAGTWGPVAWFARLRSQIKFLKNGTYVISVTFPDTHLDKTF